MTALPINFKQSVAPGTRSIAVDPDATEPATFKKGATLWIGTGGDLCVDGLRDPDGTKSVFKNVPAGPFDFAVKKVYGSGDGTTATDIIAVW